MLELPKLPKLSKMSKMSKDPQVPPPNLASHLSCVLGETRAEGAFVGKEPLKTRAFLARRRQNAKKRVGRPDARSWKATSVHPEYPSL